MLHVRTIVVYTVQIVPVTAIVM